MERNKKLSPIAVFNPRRDDWNNEWNNTKHHPLLNEQINWELDHLEKSDIVVFNFEENTISPITLLELGLFSHSNKIIVRCPENYFRVENVTQVCKRYNILMVNSIEELADEVIKRIY